MLKLSHKTVAKLFAHFPALRGGGGGYLGYFCWECASVLSEPLPHYSLFGGEL